MDFDDAEGILGAVWSFLTSGSFDVIAVGSAMVAILSAIYSGLQTRRQYRLKLADMRRSLDQSSMDWGCEAINAMSEAGELADAWAMHAQPSEMLRTEQRALRHRISALIDRGRLFFPNVEMDQDGAPKDAAFKGKRPPILDALIYVYYEVGEFGERAAEGAEPASAFIVKCRRLLVSELQAHLDPISRNAVVERFNHRMENQRDDALYRAGHLGLDLNKRRPGLLTRKNDEGWMLFSQKVDKALEHGQTKT